MPSKCSAREDSWVLWTARSTLNIHWKDWCWSWNSSILVIWWEQPSYWKSPWCWERLRAEEESVRGWDGWMAIPTQWTWNWANSRRWCGTGRPGMLQSTGLQRVGYDCVTEQQQRLSGFLYLPRGGGESLQKSTVFASAHKQQVNESLVDYQGYSITTFSVNGFLKGCYERLWKKTCYQKWGGFMKGFETAKFPSHGGVMHW